MYMRFFISLLILRIKIKVFKKFFFILVFIFFIVIFFIVFRFLRDFLFRFFFCIDFIDFGIDFFLNISCLLILWIVGIFLLIGFDVVSWFWVIFIVFIELFIERVFCFFWLILSFFLISNCLFGVFINFCLLL